MNTLCAYSSCRHHRSGALGPSELEHWEQKAPGKAIVTKAIVTLGLSPEELSFQA